VVIEGDFPEFLVIICGLLVTKMVANSCEVQNGARADPSGLVGWPTTASASRLDDDLERPTGLYHQPDT